MHTMPYNRWAINRKLLGTCHNLFRKIVIDLCRNQQLYLEVVELDPSVVEIAQNWFGFVTDERMTVTISDGLEFIALKSSKGNSPSLVVRITF